MKEYKHIVVIGPGYPYRSGQSIYISSLCTQLSETFNVTLINYTLLYPKMLFPGTTQYDESKDRKIIYPNKRMLSSINPISWWKTARYINRLNPDLVAIDWWHPFFGLAHRGVHFFLNKELKKKVVFITENVISHEANKVDKILTKFALRKAKAFLALSNAVKSQLQEMFQQRVFQSILPVYDFYQTHNHPPVLKSEFGFKDNQIVFLFFGIVRYYKGLDLLIEAFAQLKKENKEIKLLIAGEFYDKNPIYQQLIEQYQLNNDIVMVNQFIKEEEVHKYFEAADAVVLPYRSATQSGILSMAYGFKKPVLVTKVGELANLVQNKKTGLVIESSDQEQIYLAMNEFIRLHETQFDFKEHIENYIEEMDTFKEVNQVFDEIIDYAY